MINRIYNPEIIVLWHIYRGESINQISVLTGYSTSRIINHIKNIKNKTKSQSLSALTSWFSHNADHLRFPMILRTFRNEARQSLADCGPSEEDNCSVLTGIAKDKNGRSS